MMFDVRGREDRALRKQSPWTALDKDTRQIADELLRSQMKVVDRYGVRAEGTNND